MSTKWEALVRAGRTLIQGLIVTGLSAAWETAQLVIVQDGFNIKVVLTAATFAAITACVTYVYNYFKPRMLVVRRTDPPMTPQ